MINYKPYGVKIGDKHSFDDFNLIMTSKKISEPEPQLNIVEVPGASSVIDLSEVVAGHVTYKPRKIELTFQTKVEPIRQAMFQSSLNEYWNGNENKFIFDDDAAYYWIGRPVVKFSNKGRLVNVSVDAQIDPFKYDIIGTDEDWEWDPFDFETGYIQGGSDVEIVGEGSVFILGRTKQTYPIIRASAPMTVTFLGTTYQLRAGINRMYDIIIRKGENELIFKGDGNVTVNYRGGLL